MAISTPCDRAGGLNAAVRNVEATWLIRPLGPDQKSIADFRKDNGPAIRKVCTRLVELCRRLGLLSVAFVAIDGSKFKAVSNRDRNFTEAMMKQRMAQIEEGVSCYLEQLNKPLEHGANGAVIGRQVRRTS